MSAPGDSGRPSRLPEWLRVGLPRGREYVRTRELLRAKGLDTVCQSAKCPNMFECFSRRTATFLVLGKVCSRCCAFCNVKSAHGRGGGGKLLPPDPSEPGRVAEAALAMGLAHVVVTSVTRDDLPDGGAAHFAAVTEALRQALPEASVEVLIPDFQGSLKALELVLASLPDVVNHNLETVPALYARVRPDADYNRSLELLARVKARGLAAKSGLMVGLGETDQELCQVLADLAKAGCGMVTIGQYMAPTSQHLRPERYVPPELFEDYARQGRSLGIPRVFSGPLVRSSYHAESLFTPRPSSATCARSSSAGAEELGPGPSGS